MLAECFETINSLLSQKPSYRESLEICREHLPLDHFITTGTWSGLSQTLRAQKDNDALEDLFREQLELVMQEPEFS